jgi:hypothetical protein
MVAVEALVVTGDLAEIRGGPNGGDGTFAGSGDSWSVVAEVLKGGMAYWVAVGHDVELGQEGRLLEVAVGDMPSGVVGAHQGGLHIRGKRVSPVVAVPMVVEVHATHARAGGVSGAEQRRLLGH